MKYDDLDKTEELFDITRGVPTPIDNIEMEGANKDTLTKELGLNPIDEEDKTERVEKTETPKKEANKKKFNLKEKWNSLAKKKKAIIIVSSILILLFIIVLIISLIVKKDNKEQPNDEEELIVLKENYIYKDGNLIFLDDNEKEIGTYKCKNEEEDLCYVAYFSDEDEFDTEKDVFEDGTLVPKRSPIYLNKYVFIYDNSKKNNGVITLYNIETEKNEGAYTLIKGFNDSNYVILKDNNAKYGAYLINEDGLTEKIAASYDYIGKISKDSNVVVKTDKKYYIYNEIGKEISKSISYDIKSYNDKYVVISDDDKYQVYDMQGNLIFTDTFDYIRLYDDFAVLIKDEVLYIRDYDNNKYMEDGIKLKNTYYNTTNIYTEKLEKKETKEAFNLSINNDEIEISYTQNNKEKTYTININEAQLTKKINFLNYFDGTLYFYKDEDKTELIGKYACANKNVNKLENCYVAKDSFYSVNSVEENNSKNIGIIPIFNERYVFIVDSLDSNNPTIILYDLKNSKTLSKYLSVDTGSYTKETNITHKNTLNQLVMAKNKNNKYGVFTIGDEVKGVIPFNYISLEKLRDYYLVKDSANTYKLLSEKNEEITSKYGDKIVDYKNEYLITSNNSKYNIYDFKGEKIDANSYNYIKLENDYYVVITSANELDIRKYNSTFSLEEPIKINSDNYENAFTISKTENTFIIKIANSNETYEFNSETGKNIKLSNEEQ